MVQPSYRKLHDFMKNEYYKNTRPHIAASSLPNGKEYSQACLHFHTTTDLSASDINKKGREEVARINQRMVKVCAYDLTLFVFSFISIKQDTKKNYFFLFYVLD